jgi:hypothetical protein
MGNINSGGIYKLRTFCYSGNQVGINTRYLIPILVSGSPQTEQTLVNNLDGTLAPLYKPMLFNGASYIGCDLQYVSGLPPYEVQLVSFSNTGIGTGGASALPSQVSGIYTLRTSRAGRGYRGRSYIPFPPAAATTNGPPPLMTSTYQINLTALATQVTGVSTMSTGGALYDLDWCILHQSPSDVKGTTTPITGFQVGSLWATQKRRGDFGRVNPLPTS